MKQFFRDIVDFTRLGGNGLMICVFKFGFVYAKPNTVVQQRLNAARQTTDKRLFLTAPTWFNKYVWNFGGTKKTVDK